ncbi:MAG: hypothetical protein WCG13_04040 [Burkholderiales bacterium]
MSLATLDRSTIDLQRFQPAWLDNPPAHPADEPHEPPLQPVVSGRSVEEIFGLASPLLLAKALPPPGGKAAPATPPKGAQPAAAQAGSQGAAANQPIGGLFFGAKVSMTGDDGKVAIPGTNRRLDTRGFDPGLLVYFPDSKVVFASSKGQTGLLPEAAQRKFDTALGPLQNLSYLKAVGTYKLDTGNVQIGVGNSVINGKGDGFFYNIRANPEGIAKAITQSRQHAGQDVQVGSMTAGFLHSPYCDAPGKTPGFGTKLASGIAYPLRVVARDGQLSVKDLNNGMSIPLAVLDKGMEYLSKLGSNVDNFSCDSQNPLQSLATKAKAALKDVTGLAFNKLAEVGEAAAYGAVAAAGVLEFLNALNGRDLSPAH